MEAAHSDDLAVLFEQALDMPPEQRPGFLDDHCGVDTALRAQIERLLASHEDAQDYFVHLAEAVFMPTAEHEISLRERRRQVGHYQLLEKLGAGGMGVVYKARDEKLGRLVALKFLPPRLQTDPNAKTRFLHEARAVATLSHAHICTLYEIDETQEGVLFIAMAYYEGETLKARIAQGPVPAEQARAMAVQMARGLAHAHAAGIIHRDVKPANVMIAAPVAGETSHTLKLLDFGLAKAADLTLTQTGMMMGTVAYMSPEQARGEKVSPRTDLWSLGVVLYEMLTGQRPFRGEHQQMILYAVLNEAPPPLSLPGVPAKLAHIVMRCLEKDPARRYPSAAALLATSRRSIPTLPVSAALPSSPQPASPC